MNKSAGRPSEPYRLKGLSFLRTRAISFVLKGLSILCRILVETSEDFKSAYQVLNRCSCSCEWAVSKFVSFRLCWESSFQTSDHKVADSRVVVGLGLPATCIRVGMMDRGVVARRLAWTRFHAGLFDALGWLLFLWMVRLMVS